MNILTYNYYNKRHTQGIGGVLQGELLAYLMSKYYNFKFIRSKFFYFRGHEKRLNVNKWEGAFQFLNNTNKTKNQIIKNIASIKELNNKSKYILSIPFNLSLKKFSKISVSNQKKIIKNFRKLFWKSNHKLLRKSRYKNIVLHLRNFSKGDEIFGDESIIYEYFSYDYNIPNNNPKFYTNWYTSLITKIIKKNKLNKKNVKIHICSTGYTKQFNEIKKRLEKLAKVNLRLNNKSFEDFTLMINADHLIMAQSSFSYLASFINKGKKYIRNGFRQYLPFDVRVVKDYELENFYYSNYIYNNLLRLILRMKIKINKIFKFKRF